MAIEFGSADYEGCVIQAMDALAHHVFWVGLGRTTEWPVPSVPPALDRSVRELEEPVVWAVPSTISLAVPVAEAGDVTLGGQDYQLVDSEDALDLFARFIYMRADFDVDLNPSLPYADWRQAMLVTDLVPVSGHENDQWLAPAHVASGGRPWQHINKVRQTYGPGAPTTIRSIIPFR